MKTPTTVLIIDDDAAACKAYTAVLASEGYRLEIAMSGEDALRRAPNLRPDLILLDVMMPGMDGFEVCRRLRSDSSLAELPIVMVTALDDRESRLEAIEAGADDFLTKPFEVAEIRARVRTLTRLSRRRQDPEPTERLNWVVERSRNGYIAVGGDGRIRYANPRARNYLGLPDSGPLTQLNFVETVRRSYLMVPEAAWGSGVMPAPGQCRLLVRPESAAAGAFCLQVEQFDSSVGIVDHHVWRLRDVTAELRAQRERREIHFAVTHRFGAPLARLRASLAQLAEGAGSAGSGKGQTWLAEAQASTALLESAVRDVTTFLEAPSAGRSVRGLKVEDLTPIGQEVAREFGVVDFSIRVPGDLLARRLPMAAATLRLVLCEAIDNAVKHHPRTQPAVELIARDLGAGTTAIEVRDNGRCLDPAALAGVLQPRFLGDKFGLEGGAEPRIGLATVAALVWVVGGQVTLENRVDGDGVVLRLSLPEGG
jgi:CheY-like chemotaxis protein/anti-sigma regulatory factor (Ser/Thr protein kinase)